MQSLVDTLLRLPLSVQTQFRLLRMRASLNVRMAHLMRMVPYKALDQHVRKAQFAVWRAAVWVLAMPELRRTLKQLLWYGHTAGPSLNVADPALCFLVSRIFLPMRHGGLDLGLTVWQDVADTALVSAARLPEGNLAARPDGMLPRRGASCQQSLVLAPRWPSGVHVRPCTCTCAGARLRARLRARSRRLREI